MYNMRILTCWVFVNDLELVFYSVDNYVTCHCFDNIIHNGEVLYKSF